MDAAAARESEADTAKSYSTPQVGATGEEYKKPVQADGTASELKTGTACPLIDVVKRSAANSVPMDVLTTTAISISHVGSLADPRRTYCGAKLVPPYHKVGPHRRE